MTYLFDLRAELMGAVDMYPSVLGRGSLLTFNERNAFQLDLRRAVEGISEPNRPPATRLLADVLEAAVLLPRRVPSCSAAGLRGPTCGKGSCWPYLLGLSAAGIGFNSQHDGGTTLFESPVVNKLWRLRWS